MRAETLRQKKHYEAIHDAYEAHYYDSESMAFKERFIFAPLFEGVDLNGKDVADVACGSGYNSLWLKQRFPAVRTTGFDISSKACAAYRTVVGSEAHVFDLMSGAEVGRTFDAAMVLGGLHHCVSDLPGTFRTLARLVRPGGLLFMHEPNSRYVLEALRRLWYRWDASFDSETEGALDHDVIAALAASDFEPMTVRYVGGPAYFLILNSMIFRIPRKAKPLLAPLLFPLERAYNLLPGRLAFPIFVARWRRRPVSVELAADATQ
jgi:SAM-dependent methyltransferase